MKIIRLPAGNSGVDGYSEERRQLLIAAPGLMAALLLEPGKLLHAMEGASSERSLEEFIADVYARAAAFREDASPTGQDIYVEFLAEHATAIKGVSTESLATRSWKDLDPGVFLGVAGRNEIFFVVQWKFEPRAFLPAHCHPLTSVCTLGLEGSTTVRHYDAGPSAPAYRDETGKEFLIRETRRKVLLPGAVSTLTETRDNIHLFEAGPDGARGIDITTDYGGDGSFSFLEFDRDKPTNPQGREFVARWVGRRPAG